MSGGLIQLTAVGAQDVYLTGNPDTTFWKAVYRRYTNFAIESIAQTFTGQVRRHNEVITTISRNGDLINKCYLVLETNCYTKSISDVLESVELEIGGQKIDKHPGEFLDVWYQLSTPKCKEDGLQNMIIHEDEYRLYITNKDIKSDDSDDSDDSSESRGLKRVEVYPGSIIKQIFNSNFVVNSVNTTNSKIHLYEMNHDDKLKVKELTLMNGTREYTSTSGTTFVVENSYDILYDTSNSYMWTHISNNSLYCYKMKSDISSTSFEFALNSFSWNSGSNSLIIHSHTHFSLNSVIYDQHSNDPYIITHCSSDISSLKLLQLKYETNSKYQFNSTYLHDGYDTNPVRYDSLPGYNTIINCSPGGILYVNSYDSNCISYYRLNSYETTIDYSSILPRYTTQANYDVTQNSIGSQKFEIIATDNSYYFINSFDTNSVQLITLKNSNITTGLSIYNNSFYNSLNEHITTYYIKRSDIVFSSQEGGSKLFYIVNSVVYDNSLVLLSIENSQPDSEYIEWKSGIPNYRYIMDDNPLLSEQINNSIVINKRTNSAYIINSHDMNSVHILYELTSQSVFEHKWQYILDPKYKTISNSYVTISHSNSLFFDCYTNSVYYATGVELNSLCYYEAVNSNMIHVEFQSILSGFETMNDKYVLPTESHMVVKSSNSNLFFYKDNSYYTCQIDTSNCVISVSNSYYKYNDAIEYTGNIHNNSIYEISDNSWGYIMERFVKHNEFVYSYKELTNSIEHTFDMRIENNIAFRNKMLYIPLAFFFCNDPALSLPLVALQNNEVRMKITFGEHVVNDSASLWVDYIYLDNDERKLMAQNEHEIMITQLQYCKSIENNIPIFFSHPCKELIWKTNSEYETAVLLLNGHERMTPRDMKYYQCTQPLQRHTRVPKMEEHLSVYSFAMEPENQLQPSGSCNFSRIDNVELRLTGDDINETKIWALNWNILKIVGGVSGMTYSN